MTLDLRLAPCAIGSPSICQLMLRFVAPLTPFRPLNPLPPATAKSFAIAIACRPAEIIPKKEKEERK